MILDFGFIRRSSENPSSPDGFAAASREQMSDDGGQRVEVRGRESEVRAQHSALNTQHSAIPIIAMTAHAMKGDRAKYDLTRISKLLPGCRQSQGSSVEAGRAALIGVAADAPIKIHIPDTQCKTGHHHKEQEKIDGRL